tara:strand:- start:16 stop:1179 length:1164 start_codon:yes stop_codon:yes gene_type:complete
MKKKFLKIFAINFSFTFILILFSLETYLRLNDNYKSLSINDIDTYKTISDAARAAQYPKEMVLVVGDSFAAHQKGSQGNLFDSVFDCSVNNACNFYNLAIPGTDPATYWKSINYVLKNRSKDAKTKIIMAFFYGNDFFINKKSQENCKEIFGPENIGTKPNIKSKIKRASFTLNLSYRFFKEKLSLGKNNKQKLFKVADSIRFRVKDWDEYPKYSETLSKIPKNIILKAKNDILNPLEISLALANPFYFEELYSMSKYWSLNSVQCSLTNFEENLGNILQEFPSLEFTLIGIPDKLFWNMKTTENVIQEYRDLGYEVDLAKNIDYLLLPNKFKYLNKKLDFQFLHLPELPGLSNIDLSKYFYTHDMHINKKGNIFIAKELLKYFKQK